MISRAGLLIALFSYLEWSTPVEAAVLTYGCFSGADPDSSETVASFDLSTGALAVGFVANAANYTLSSVRFDLSRGGNSTARLRVYQSNPGGVALFTSANASLSTAAAIVTFSSINVGLVAGQTYWLVIDANSGTGSTRLHSAAGSQIASGAGSLTMIGYRIYNEALSSHGGTITSDLPNFSVTVPEPQRVALVGGLGLAGFALSRFRQGSSKTRSE